MTGAVEVVTAKDIANKGFTSIEDVLKGTLAGVTTMSITAVREHKLRFVSGVSIR